MYVLSSVSIPPPQSTLQEIKRVAHTHKTTTRLALSAAPLLHPGPIWRTLPCRRGRAMHLAASRVLLEDRGSGVSVVRVTGGNQVHAWRAHGGF